MIESWDKAPQVFVSVLAVYVIILTLIRIRGLRSLSKMSPGDFITTLAIGSIFGASVLNPEPSVAVTGTALVSIFLIQVVVTKLRRSTSWVQPLLSNAPLLIMKDGEVLSENLASTDISEGELRAKLREANVVKLSQVLAVIVEGTGDVSVLHSDDHDEIDDWIMKGVEEKA